jgi:site-specific recombinase XerD
MNRRPSGLKLDKAVPGFLQYKAAEGLSPRTLVSYEYNLKLWSARASDVDVSEVTSQDIRSYLAWLRTDYKTAPLGEAIILRCPKQSAMSAVMLSALVKQYVEK